MKINCLLLYYWKKKNNEYIKIRALAELSDDLSAACMIYKNAKKKIFFSS